MRHLRKYVLMLKNLEQIQFLGIFSIFTMKSGSTCCVILMTDSKLITANVGDSRCIVGISQSEKLCALQLTRDDKPYVNEEMNRIIRAGGVVLRYEKNMVKGPYRVFAKGQNIPGLAISRSIGDNFASKYGVIQEPSIILDISENRSK